VYGDIVKEECALLEKRMSKDRKGIRIKINLKQLHP
jgi:hypothetical protein